METVQDKIHSEERFVLINDKVYASVMKDCYININRIEKQRQTGR